MKKQTLVILAVVAVITSLLTVSALSNKVGYKVSPCDAIDLSLENATVSEFLNATNMTTVHVYNFKGYKGENTWMVQWSSSNRLLNAYVNVAMGNIVGIEEKTSLSPTATPTPTPTSTLTPEVIPFSGAGQEATSKFSLEKGLSIFKMTHDGDSNFAIWLFDGEGDRIDLLVNEIGEFDGSTAVGIKKLGDYLLDISADGRWTITIEQPRPTYAPPVPKTLKGKGQQASELFYLNKGLARFKMTHDGDSNFAIWLFDDEGDRIDLLVNEIGEFDGSTAIGIRKGGIYLLDISADGNWEISIE